MKPATAAAAAAAAPKKTEAPTSENTVKAEEAEKSIADGLESLKIALTAPGLVLNDAALDAAADRQAGTAGTSSTAASAAASATPSANQTNPSSSDEVSQKADFNFELGTKPPSLDGKSITSGTTFNALDEKESLRPDDSASVKAAADEDDSFSVRRSLLVSSRMGSDVAARVQRIQLGDMPPRLVPLSNQDPVVSGAVTPHSNSSEQQPVTEARVQLATSASTPGGVNGQNPDEKLLDAMSSQKNRVFLLRLESEVVDFVQNSKEPFMDLPPSNSFCRMLTHKLADYYHMTHSFEAVAGSVRIYRTPFCRVPPPLASFVPVNTPESTNTPPQIVKPRKIMRRGEEFDQSTSAGPSKPTSEDGSDSKDKAPPAKEKMTREEREEAYNKARERIFAMPTEASTPENDDGTGISRASSVSAKDRAALGKKGKTGKQRRDDSESFDSRSQYTPFYHHSQQATWVKPQFMLTGNLVNIPYNTQQQPQGQPLPQQQQQQPHGPHYASNNMQPPIAYGTSQSLYPPVVSGNSHIPPANGMPHVSISFAHLYVLPHIYFTNTTQYTPQPGPPRHPAQNGPPPYQYTQPGQPPNATPPQHWQQHQQPPYNGAAYPPSQARPGPPSGGPLPAGMTYAYGQLPAHFNLNDPKAQHPIPGSYAGTYTRHGFNPKTQSFVPGTGPMAIMPMATMPIPVAGPHGAYGANGGPVPMGMSPGQPQGVMPYNNGGGFQQANLSTSPYGGSATSSYGMMRQGSSSSTNAYPLGQQPYPGPVAYHDPYGNNMGHGPPVPGAPVHGHMPGPHGQPHGAPHGAPRGPSHYKMNAAHNAAHGGPKKPNGAQAPEGPNQANGSPQGQKGSGQAYGNLPNYGNPATLPQKPTSTQ